MRTTQPISTISYNTSNFLEFRLNELVKSHKISFWCFIRHNAEQDEKKDHTHLYIEPNGKIDTMDLQDMLVEIDPLNPGKPLKCVDWRSSKWEDWYLYGKHDEMYLRMKFMTREYTYLDSNFVSSDIDEFEVKAHRAMHSDIIKVVKVNELLNKGHTLEQMAYRGMVLPAQAMQLKVYTDLWFRGLNIEKHYEEERKAIEKQEEQEKLDP